MIQDIRIPRVIYIYKEGIKNFNFKEIKGFINKNFGWPKIHLLNLGKEIVHTKGLIFDFISTKKFFDKLKYARIKDSCHIILTDKLFATFAEDGRPHIRASIYSFPLVISTSGVVEGPAKPREYYLYKQKYTQLGVWDIEELKIKRRLRKRFIDYQDKRLSEVLKGYIAQGLFFYSTGQPFCKHKKCRLYNAHWQEDLIYSQIKSAKFCRQHQRFLDKFIKQ